MGARAPGRRVGAGWTGWTAMKDLEQAAAILAAAEAVGAVVLIDGNKLKVRNSILLPSSVRADVDGNWRALAELFKGDHCRCCGRLIDWRRDGVAFADHTAAHIACYERAEAARQAGHTKTSG